MIINGIRLIDYEIIVRTVIFSILINI